MGKRAGAATFIGDLLKGTISVLIGQLIANFIGIDRTIAGYVAVIFVVVGHN